MFSALPSIYIIIVIIIVIFILFIFGYSVRLRSCILNRNLAVFNVSATLANLGDIKRDPKLVFQTSLQYSTAALQSFGQCCVVLQNKVMYCKVCSHEEPSPVVLNNCCYCYVF